MWPIAVSETHSGWLLMGRIWSLFCQISPRPHQDWRGKKRGETQRGLIQQEAQEASVSVRSVPQQLQEKLLERNCISLVFMISLISAQVNLFLNSWLHQWKNATKLWCKKVTSFSFSYHTAAFLNQTTITSHSSKPAHFLTCKHTGSAKPLQHERQQPEKLLYSSYLREMSPLMEKELQSKGKLKAVIERFSNGQHAVLRPWGLLDSHRGGDRWLWRYERIHLVPAWLNHCVMSVWRHVWWPPNVPHMVALWQKCMRHIQEHTCTPAVIKTSTLFRILVQSILYGKCSSCCFSCNNIIFWNFSLGFSTVRHLLLSGELMCVGFYISTSITVAQPEKGQCCSLWTRDTCRAACEWKF